VVLGKNANGDRFLSWEWVGMGMGMVLWEWEGMGTEIVLPAHLYSARRLDSRSCAADYKKETISRQQTLCFVFRW